MNRFLKAAGLTAVYVVVLLAVYVIHMRYFAVDVVFYAAIGDAFIALVITGLLLLLPSIQQQPRHQ